VQSKMPFQVAMLWVTYVLPIGGLSDLVGTRPRLLALYLEELDIEFVIARWMALGVTLCVCFVALLGYC